MGASAASGAASAGQGHHESPLKVQLKQLDYAAAAQLLEPGAPGSPVQLKPASGADTEDPRVSAARELADAAKTQDASEDTARQKDAHSAQDKRRESVTIKEDQDPFDTKEKEEAKKKAGIEPEEAPKAAGDAGPDQDDLDDEARIKVSGKGLTQVSRPNNKRATTGRVEVLTDGEVGIEIGGSEEVKDNDEELEDYETTAAKKEKRRARAKERAKRVAEEKKRQAAEKERLEKDTRARRKKINHDKKRRRLKARKAKEEKDRQRNLARRPPGEAVPAEAPAEAPAQDAAPKGPSKVTTTSASGKIAFDPDKKRVVLGAKGGRATVEDPTPDGPPPANQTEDEAAEAEKKRKDRTTVNETSGGVDVGIGADGKGHVGGHVTRKKGNLNDNSSTTVAGKLDSDGGSASVSNTRKKADGTSTNLTGGATIDNTTGEKTVTLGASETKPDGEKGAHGSATISKRNHKQEGKGTGYGAEISGGVGGKTVQVGGQYDFYVTRPKGKKDGTWEVLVVEKRSNSLGGAASGKKAGGSGKLSSSKSKTLKKVFRGKDAKAKAQAFYKTGYVDALKRKFDARRVEELQEGDTVTISDGGGAEGAAKLKAGPVEIGLSVKRARSAGLTILKEKGSKVVVEVDRALVTGVGASLGTSAGGITWGSSEDQSESYKVRFDLKKDRAAFDALVRSRGRMLPKSGWTIIGTARMRRETDTVEAKLLGAKVSTRSWYEQKRKTDEHGNKVEEDTGGKGAAATVPGLGSVDRTDELHATEINDKERLFVGRSTVNDSSASDSHKALSRAEGHKRNRLDVAGKGSGKWSVTTVFSEAHIDAFIEKARSGKVNAAGLGSNKGALESLKRRLNAIRGLPATVRTDLEREALAKFVRKTGSEGLAKIRGDSGGKRYVELKGDKNFTGLAGRLALKKKVATWQKALSTVDTKKFTSLKRQIRSELRRQKKRLLAISDPKRYPDLPSTMREDEVADAREQIETLKGLYAQARVGAKKHAAKRRRSAREKRIDEIREQQKELHGEIASDRNYTHESDDYQEDQCMVPEVDRVAEAQKEEDAKEAKVKAAQAKLTAARKGMERARSRARKMYVAAWQRWNSHNKARKQVLWGGWSDVEHRLQRARGPVPQVITRTSHAEKAADVADDSNPETMLKAAALFRACTRHWESVVTNYSVANQQLVRLEKKHALKEDGLLGARGTVKAPF